MRYLLLIFLIFILTSCCRTANQPLWTSGEPLKSSVLYKIRIQQAEVTKFSGLLALEPKIDGIQCVLLDATGIPLLKEFITPNGTMQVEHSVGTIKDSKLPNLLNRVIEYSFYTPAATDCPWYDPYRVCIENNALGKRTKWKKLGPVRLWQVDRTHLADKREVISITMAFSTVRVTLQPLAEEEEN